MYIYRNAMAALRIEAIPCVQQQRDTFYFYNIESVYTTHEEAGHSRRMELTH